MSSSAKILCIEDDAEISALICEELTERGYDVSSAQNGQEGLAAILRICPDLVLADVSMPVMTGFELLECLSKLEMHFSSIPFVFLTALGDRENELKGRRLGADDYITKPVDFEILDTIIKARLNRAPPSELRPPSQFHLNDREIEVLTWAARGKTSHEISQILHLTKRTIDFHFDNARTKLGAITRIQATIIAASEHLINP